MFLFLLGAPPTLLTLLRPLLVPATFHGSTAPVPATCLPHHHLEHVHSCPDAPSDTADLQHRPRRRSSGAPRERRGGCALPPRAAGHARRAPTGSG